MKTKYLLLGAIFAVFGLSARAQISEMYYQGFETSDGVNYTATPSSNMSFSTNIRCGGSRALKLVQSTSQEVELILDTIDFTQNTTLRYIALRFDHICRVPMNSSTDYHMAKIFYKRINQSDWTAMSDQEYNISSGTATQDFGTTSSFRESSYSDWMRTNVSAVANDQWHSERFDLDNVMTSQVPANERKLLIKFVLYRRTSECAVTLDPNNMAWWIDNIRISASAERMVTPKITMVEYPTIERYPNSRGAHIELAATTPVTAGINSDSVYLIYKGGSDPTQHRLEMTPTGEANHFECRIPFYGYDTLMHFYCVARDATGNSNKVTYPSTSDTWITYRCVRGNTVQPGIERAPFIGNSSTSIFPFSSDADHRCEMIYDSASMAAAGYGPGAITALTYTLATSVSQPRTEQRFQIKMKNVPANYAVTLGEDYAYHFTVDAMQTVYDSVLTVPANPSNSKITITLQDTFYYTGNDIVVQMTYDGTVDRNSGISIKTIPTTANKMTLLTLFNGNAEYGYNPFIAEDFETTHNTDESKRPAFVFTETHLQPLLYDVGISALIDPSYDVPMTDRPDSITVRLKNYGERTVNGVRISYNIDNSIFGHYDWTGALAGGDSTNVLIATNINIPAGFHTLVAWVEDSVLSNGQMYRDHEPYNDTSTSHGPSEFVVCDGPMSGIVNIGGNNSHFNSIEEFLFSLSRCGVDDSLIVRLASGLHPAFTMPVVPGVSESNYIVFESRNNQTAGVRAVLYSDVSTDSLSIVNLENTQHIRFRNLDFKRFDGALTEMVTLGSASVDCRFEGCRFIDMMENPVGVMRISSMINSGTADNMRVDSCSFNGGNIAVNVRGTAPDDYSDGVVIRKCTFNDQYTNAIKVEYMDSVVVVDNEIYDVLTNSSYVVLLNGCAGFVDVERNVIYTSHGAGAMAVNDVTGIESRHAIVANNMIVSADDGTANLLTTPLNVIQGNWIDVVYNSVKMVAPTRINIAAATFGGGTLNNSRFMNNIIATFDDVNYAFSFQPLGSTTNTIARNDYFSNGVVMNRRGTSSYTSLALWQAAMPDDSMSVSVNPNFLNTTPVDLRTYNRNLKGVGLPVPAVPIDIFGNVRGDSATCPGAFEFSSLPYDFEPEALVSPLQETCNMPSSVELVVRLRNNGIGVYDSTNTQQLQLRCQVNNGTVHTININQTVPADDTVSLHTGHMLNLPSGTYNDATYTIRVWNVFAGDPNPMNDTNIFTVLSRYHPAAPASILDSVPYATSDTITPTVGINTWQVYGNAGAPRRPSQISWYLDSNDTEPFYVGPTYITSTLHQDATYYIRQRRSMPIVRITQVEILHAATSIGVTSPMPYWMENARKAAVQLTNIGDATAYLEGDTLMTVSTTSGLHNKIYTFGNVKIEPGESLVLQYVSNGVTDSTLTLRTGFAPNFAANSVVAFVYKRNGVIEDAVPFNSGIITSTPWTSLGVPSYVWNGAAIAFPANTSGVYRNGFNGGVGDWEFSTTASPMFLGTTNENWVMYEDFGCEGDMAQVAVHIIQPPVVDASVGTPILPESGCGLGLENVSVNISNFGGDTITNLVMNYCAGADTITDTIFGMILSGHDTTYTFTTPLNLAFSTDSVVTVRVWTTADVDDPIRWNDTSEAVVTTLFTPSIPPAMADRVVHYATNDTISHIPTSAVMPIWYDYNLNPVDTGYTHVTELLYTPGTRGMSYLAMKYGERQVGTGTSTNGNTAFPSPYQPSSKYVKQQYLYSASDLAAVGTKPGEITTLSFYLESILGTTTTSINFLNYTITVGLVSDTIFTATTAAGWKSAPDTVYTRDTLTLYKDDAPTWVTHVLDTPFQWDGVSTVVVQITYNLSSKISTGVKTRYTAKSNTTLHKNQDNPITPTTAQLTKGANRPNIRFGGLQFYGCSGPITTFNVTLSGMPQNDAALFWADGHDTLVYNSCDTIALPINIRNRGSETIDSMMLYYSVDNLPYDSLLITDTIVSDQLFGLTFLGEVLSPGRHSVVAHVGLAGDTIPSNDTIRGTFTVRFCGGNYTIAANDATADYLSFGAAIDTLNQVGVVGPVTFQVSPALYTEQVVLNNIDGSSSVNTISFVGQADGVILRASTSQTANYVMKIDGASNVRLENLMFDARPTANNVNYANALVILNDSNIRITDCHFKVKGTIVNANASCIVLQGNVTDLTISGSVTDSGYYALKTAGAETGYSNIYIHDNTFRDFASGGIYIRGINRVNVTHNEIRSGNSANNRGLIGIYMAATTDSMVIQKNAIYLVDERQGAKRGIQLENVVGTMASPALVLNNMISTNGNGSAGLSPAKSAGIWIDSLSNYINVFYNSVRVKGSNVTEYSTAGQLNTANGLSYAFWCGASPTNISLINNILSNYGFGYAYYVSQNNAVSNSNNNAYYTQAAKKFAWGTADTLASLGELQALNSLDGNSLLEEPYFYADTNLHLRMTNFAAKAQYNPDVIDDIDGTTRSPIGPTIGAHEKLRENHDMAVVKIMKPVLPASLANPNNIETDPVRVVASFHNNGLSNESGVYWYAYIEGYESTTRSSDRSLGTFLPAQLKVDSLMMPTVLGIIDTQRVHVVVVANNDQNLADNELSKPFYLAPAYDLAALKMSVTNSYTPAGCRMQGAQVSINVKNNGSKPFAAGTSFEIGYHTEITNPTTVTIPTLPDTVRQIVTLDNILPAGSDVWINFDSLANLYPTGTFTNIKVRVKGWVNFQYDVVPNNDSTAANNTASPLVDSYFTPAPPHGYDTTLAYGSWGEVRADQQQQRPIRWYRDSTDAFFYPTTNLNNYNQSRKWSSTPQYYHDSTYYLNAFSDKNCPSYFSPVHVTVMPRKTRDVAVEHMLAPLGGRVYMENDTVRVQIANYGTAPQSNFPITYQLKRGNTVIQTVTDTVRENLVMDQTYIYTFDTLLNITTPTSAQNYSLKVWTDLVNDATPRNDTLRTPHAFASKDQVLYQDFDEYPSSDNTAFDITRVSFNGIDFNLAPLAPTGRAYTDLADYNDLANPPYPVLHVTRGTTDSIIIQASLLDVEQMGVRGRGSVFIDFNRDGVFANSGGCNEVLMNNKVFYLDSLLTSVITIPQCASLGYMRMRVKVMGYSGESTEGHIIDFMLFVDDTTPSADLALTQIVTPRDNIVRGESPRVVRFRMANRGSSPITSIDIHYSFVGDTIDTTATGVVQWTGNLDAGHSTVVALPAHLFPLGTSTLTIWHNMAGDADSTNDTLRYEYHHPYSTYPIVRDDFEGPNRWYAPTGNTAYTRNYWQRGMPNKIRLDSTYSGENAWVTGLTGNVDTKQFGNVSYLYSPIINMSVVRPDTIAIRLKRNLTNESFLYLEYYNYERKWVRLNHQSAQEWCIDSVNGTFTGTSSNAEGYAYYCISAHEQGLTNDFNENLQFRIVYTTPELPKNTNLNFGEGCAIDDFYVGRARAKWDIGVVGITYPTAPKYGQTIYPKVAVINYGRDTVRQLNIGYTTYGSYLARMSHFNCYLAPLTVDTFECADPFIVTNDYPDTFYLTAFTSYTEDIYRDNDTMTQKFSLSPLENDICAEEIVTPLKHVVAGDTTIRVTLRIRNFGENPISTATATFVVNGLTRVDEQIDFQELLGHPLQSLQYFNYTFQRHITAPMGIMDITAFIKSPNNDYIYNDTVTKRVEGIMSVTDIAATSVIVDTSDHTVTRIALVIDNVGARGVNNFEVGYWIDNDTSNMVHETYYRAQPLAALNTGYYLFDATLPNRSSGYNIVSAFVHVNGDNDPSNDTTSVIGRQYIDVEVKKVLIEENASNDCRVFLELQNIGNVAVVGQQICMRACINGGDSIKTNIVRRIDPGEVFHLEFNRRVPKSPTRHYVGSGWITPLSGDTNTVNDQTSIVEVINYFEGAPTVNGENLVLEQNYPNPFSQQTTIPFTLPNAATVRFFIMDAMGHIVHRAEKFYQAGPQLITIDMEAFAAGVYYYGIEVDGQRQMRKMILR